MKKSLIGVIVSVFLAMNSFGALAANDSNIEVKNESRTITYSYTAGDDKEAVKSITDLFNKIDDITIDEPSTTQVITVKSNTGNGDVMNLTLRMTDQKDYKDEDVTEEDSVLTYYNINITDSEGNIIAKTSADAEDILKNDDGVFVKNLNMGDINTQFTTETKIYNIEISAPSDTTESRLAQAKENIEWELVCIPARLVENESEEDPSVTPEANEATATPEIVTQTPVATALAATPAPEQNAKGIKYIGEDKDIIPGKYTVTGNGTVKVYNSEDELKTNILLTDGEKESEGGISSYVLNLVEGDRLEISDYINLKPFTTATATPKATEKATATPKATAKATTKPSSTKKTNPKTGDTAPITAVSVIAVLALGACVYIEISKRKKN